MYTSGTLQPQTVDYNALQIASTEMVAITHERNPYAGDITVTGSQYGVLWALRVKEHVQEVQHRLRIILEHKPFGLPLTADENATLSDVRKSECH